jgi:peptidoglycan-associated lipoprotein
MFMLRKRKLTVIGMALALALLAAACKKKVAPPPPPQPQQPTTTSTPPPTPGAPTISSFTADPATIQRGESSTLRWEVAGQTTSVSIDQGIGTVTATGNRRVFPTGSTTYTLTAMGGGGSVTARAIVNVAEPPPPAPPPGLGTPPATIGQRLAQLKDALFDYDKSDIRSDARDALTQDASALKSILADFPSNTIIVEGHCDERGSAEYNIGLGDRRATAAKDFLVQLGVPAGRLMTRSYGKERPQCTDSNESCWQSNRRAAFSLGQ